MKLGVDAALSYSSESELEGAVATPLRFNQDELYDLIKDLNLSKETYEVIATWLKKKIYNLILTIRVIAQEKTLYCPIFPEKTTWFSVVTSEIFYKKMGFYKKCK